MSPFALQQMVVTGEKFIQPQASSTSTTSTTSVSTATCASRPRLSSMHSKLDHTKINAAMYQKPLVRTPSLPEDMRGSIQLSLTYDINFGLLVVNLLQARDLVPRDATGTTDPYAKIRVLPDTVNFRHSRKLEKEHWKYSSMTLINIQGTQGIGSMQLPFERIDFSDRVTLWKGISPCDEKDEKVS
uniref:C2 domain-containing protein n=1 Tax=Strigamia maritima TaxID=126957 RepID=T1JI30_STRMM